MSRSGSKGTRGECDGWNKATITKPIIPKTKSLPMSIKVDYRSTYRKDFVPVSIERSLYHGPTKKPWKSEGKFEVNSMYRTEFRRHPPQPFIKRTVTEKEYQPPSRPMNIRSSYSHDFPRKQGAPAKTAKKPVFVNPKAPPMDDSSTYKTQFLAWCMEPKPAKKTQDEIIQENNAGRVPFYGQTTYKKDFRPIKNPCYSKSVKPLQSVRYPLGKFDGSTIYRCAYQPFYY